MPQYRFFPSCKAKADFPKESARAAEYLENRFGIRPEGCCRPGHKKLTADDTAVFVCNNCAAVIEENTEASLKSLWELIDEDPYFPFPDYGGEEITVQDCWIAFEKRKVQDAVRSLLRKMNFRIAELPENYEKTRFCGENLLGPCTESNRQLVHHRYVELYPEMFTPMTEEEKDAHFRAHCGKIRTRRTACYCRFCRRGIERGGKEALHMLQLLFPASEGSQV